MSQQGGPSRAVLVDKPADWTSYDVIRRVKRGLKIKVGHAGTLDPFATGLLVVLFGSATRISSLIMDLPKEYKVLVQFGFRSSTGDATGEIEAVSGQVSARELLLALDAFRGPVLQKVPLHSAVKVSGQRLYELARRGERVETPSREVMVYDSAMLSFDEARQQAEILLVTGKGAYVRQIAADLGERLGTAAYAAALRRTRSGPFSVEDALVPDSVSSEVLAEPSTGVLNLDNALGFLPAYRVSGGEEVRARNGGKLRGTPAGRFRVVGEAGLLGVWEAAGEEARPVLVFPDSQDCADHAPL